MTSLSWNGVFEDHTLRSSVNGSAAEQHTARTAQRAGLRSGGRDERSLDAAAQQLDFARWFADWWLRRGRRLAAEADRRADG